MPIILILENDPINFVFRRWRKVDVEMARRHGAPAMIPITRSCRGAPWMNADRGGGMQSIYAVRRTWATPP